MPRSDNTGLHDGFGNTICLEMIHDAGKMTGHVYACLCDGVML